MPFARSQVLLWKFLYTKIHAIFMPICTENGF